jgi:hypothetical protein
MPEQAHHMNRRKAIFRISLGGAALVAAVSGYKWYDLTKSPDISFLEKSGGLIADLSETIIPATDTPGAREAGVHEFIIRIVKDCANRQTQNRFIDGLKDVQVYCRMHYGKSYANCSDEQKHSVLKHFEEKGKDFRGIVGKVQKRYLGKSFFATLKEYTVAGYCNSRPGATKGLAMLYVPGRYEGCVSLQPGQKAWATN